MPSAIFLCEISKNLGGGKSRNRILEEQLWNNCGFCGSSPLVNLDQSPWPGAMGHGGHGLGSHRTLCTILSTAAAVVERAMAPVSRHPGCFTSGTQWRELGFFFVTS